MPTSEGAQFQFFSIPTRQFPHLLLSPSSSFVVKESCTAVAQCQAGTAATHLTTHLLSEGLFLFYILGKLRDEMVNCLI